MDPLEVNPESGIFKKKRFTILTLKNRTSF